MSKGPPSKQDRVVESAIGEEPVAKETEENEEVIAHCPYFPDDNEYNKDEYANDNESEGEQDVGNDIDNDEGNTPAFKVAYQRLFEDNKSMLSRYFPDEWMPSMEKEEEERKQSCLENILPFLEFFREQDLVGREEKRRLWEEKQQKKEASKTAPQETMRDQPATTGNIQTGDEDPEPSTTATKRMNRRARKKAKAKAEAAAAAGADDNNVSKDSANKNTIDKEDGGNNVEANTEKTSQEEENDTRQAQTNFDDGKPTNDEKKMKNEALEQMKREKAELKKERLALEEKQRLANQEKRERGRKEEEAAQKIAAGRRADKLLLKHITSLEDLTALIENGARCSSGSASQAKYDDIDGKRLKVDNSPTKKGGGVNVEKTNTGPGLSDLIKKNNVRFVAIDFEHALVLSRQHALPIEVAMVEAEVTPEAPPTACTRTRKERIELSDDYDGEQEQYRQQLKRHPLLFHTCIHPGKISRENLYTAMHLSICGVPGGHGIPLSNAQFLSRNYREIADIIAREMEYKAIVPMVKNDGAANDPKETGGKEKPAESMPPTTSPPPSTSTTTIFIHKGPCVSDLNAIRWIFAAANKQIREEYIWQQQQAGGEEKEHQSGQEDKEEEERRNDKPSYYDLSLEAALKIPLFDIKTVEKYVEEKMSSSSKKNKNKKNKSNSSSSSNPSEATNSDTLAASVPSSTNTHKSSPKNSKINKTKNNKSKHSDDKMREYNMNKHRLCFYHQDLCDEVPFEESFGSPEVAYCRYRIRHKHNDDKNIDDPVEGENEQGEVEVGKGKKEEDDDDNFEPPHCALMDACVLADRIVAAFSKQ